MLHHHHGHYRIEEQGYGSTRDTVMMVVNFVFLFWLNIGLWASML